jgi:uncharacterized protein YndB with AHSA1/START domain
MAESEEYAMQARNVEHDTIVIERDFNAAPARVFAAWASPSARAEWAVPSGEWESVEQGNDFRVGGHEVSRFGPPGDPRYKAETNYLDIVPDSRIIMAGTMFDSERPISCSLATVELLSAGRGTHMRYTEQAAFLDGRDSATPRRHGWKINLDKLEAYLTRGSQQTQTGEVQS